MNRICALALAALSLPFAVEAAAQSADRAAATGAAAKPAPTTSASPVPPKAVPAPQKPAAGTTTPAAQKTVATTTPAPQKTAATTTAAPHKTAGMSQQDKMRYCNKEATGKKGAERKAFMKSCLSSRKAA